MATRVIRVDNQNHAAQDNARVLDESRARAPMSSPERSTERSDRLHFKTGARVSKRTTEEKGNDASVQAVHWTRQCVTRS